MTLWPINAKEKNEDHLIWYKIVAWNNKNGNKVWQRELRKKGMIQKKN